MAVKIVAEYRNSIQRGEPAALPFQPAQRGIDRAILFFMTILRTDKSGANEMTLSLPGLTNTGVTTVCE
ncbi:MAG: hypothetical protein Q7U66_03720 [Methylobacter sp.]|nr:hypothetical protein [Methylobacter sp.]